MEGKMSSFLAIIAISLEVLPIFCHRLITNPYPDHEWDSVVVSSDPITIRDKTQNVSAPLKHYKVLKPQKRSYEECPENDFECLYGKKDEVRDTEGIVDKFIEQYAHPDNSGALSERTDYSGDNSNSRNSYWTIVDAQTHHHPFDDKQGWVTLDPVPWSTSKIAKWHPNKVTIHHENRPWDFPPTTQRPSVHQFWVSGSHYNPERPSSQWGIGTNDIITDNKPSAFPTEDFHGYGRPNHVSNQEESGTLPGHYNHFQQSNDFKGNYPSNYRQPQRHSHPSTYPSNGNGEWVLLSTTKGYSHPQRHRWPIQKDFRISDQRVFASRKIKTTDISKYHEEDLNLDNSSVNSSNGSSNGSSNSSGNSSRKSDMNTQDNSSSTADRTPLQILYTASSSKDKDSTTTFRRKVRLQVLPSLESSSTSYGGLLEVDSNNQTVDEAQQEDEKLQKLKGIANVKKNKIRGYKLIPTSKITGKGMNQRNVMTLAAVGAGMIPATMALLVPMALGRKKRSLDERKREITERVIYVTKP